MSKRPIMRRAWIVWLLVLPGCASVAPRPPAFPVDELVRTDALIDNGCYSCLMEAQAAFAKLATGPYRAHVLPLVFETDLLLVLRHQELAMPLERVLGEARNMVSMLPPEMEAERYLSLVEAVAGDPVGITEGERLAFARVHQGLKSRLPAQIAWLEDGPLGRRFGAYLATALRCSWDPPEPRRASEATVVPPDEAPLLTYRRAICGDVPNVQALEVVRALVPEFHEATYYLARGWIADLQRFGLAKPTAAVFDVLPRLPESPSVAVTAAGIQRGRRLCEEALELYARTLALRPGHENAVLGRTECLSVLKRHDEAIDEATALIGLGGRNLAMAYYWRAWNQHTLGRLPRAREDIELAKRATARPDPNISLLAGVIEHDQDDLDRATADLRQARTLSYGRACLAYSYLALVSIKRGNWAESATSFHDAMECYAQNSKDSRGQLTAVEADADMAPDFKAVRVAELQASIVESEKQRHVAAMNSAKGYANTGDFAAAVRLGTIAQEDPALASDVQVLREFLVASKSPVQLPDVLASDR